MKLSNKNQMLGTFIGFKKITLKYCRSGFDCEILMITNCKLFWRLQTKESQSILECITIIWYGVDHHNHKNRN